MTFRVGMKVVCIGGFDATDFVLMERFCAPMPVVNSVYQITAFHDDHLELVELPPPVGATFIAFHRSRFRPLLEHKTDIGFAHEILRRSSKQVDA